MRLKRNSNGQIISIDVASRLGGGGEGEIYAVSQHPDLVAKIYKQPQNSPAGKLKVMIAHPPKDPMAAQGTPSIAWPCDLLHPAGRKVCVGYLMPRIDRVRTVFEFYNPAERHKHCPQFTYLYLHRAARNLAAAVNALHARGHIIGDVNESNVFVSDNALVTLIDTDSFQVRDPNTGTVYRCGVGRPEYTAPELHAQLRNGKTYRDVDRTI